MQVFSEFLDASEKLRRRQYAEAQRQFYADYMRPLPAPTREQYLAMQPYERDQHQKLDGEYEIVSALKELMGVCVAAPGISETYFCKVFERAEGAIEAARAAPRSASRS